MAGDFGTAPTGGETATAGPMGSVMVAQPCHLVADAGAAG